MMNTAWRLSDMAVTQVKAVRPDDTVRRAHALMDGYNVDQIPVVNETADFAGVVTRRGLAGRLDWDGLRVRDVAQSPNDPAEVLRSPDTPLDLVFEYLFENDFVLIAENGENVTGIVTINDVAKFLYEQALQN